MNRALAPEKRAELLVQAMTVDEKIAQIHMRDLKGFPREVIGIERLGLPAFKVSNGPVGAGPGDSHGNQPATAFPSALAIASTFDPSVAETFGNIAAQEIASRGESLLEAPGLNITRVPQNGRNFEYFGEDPFLSGSMGIAEVRGIQSAGIIAEPKHFDANNQEYERKTINEVIDERTLREIYLPAFEMTVKEANPGAIMCAYPSVNGEFSCQNTHLLTDILRGDWGFQGFVQSDYTATRDAAANAAAGLDLAMKPDHYSDEMRLAIQSGKISESQLNALVLRRLAAMFRMGWFDHPPKLGSIPAEPDGEKARSIAEHGAVLLKNADNQLPLEATAVHSIALIGPYAGAAHTGGGGSSAVTPIYTVTPEQGLHRLTTAKITFNDGSDPGAAAAVAETADVAVIMVGNKDRENQDRSNLSLPENQNPLIAAVAAANAHTIVVLKTGGPVLMPWLDSVQAVLEAWYPGEEDGDAVAELLFGKVNPSGKLPMTFPKTEDQVPAHTPQQYPGLNGVVTYSEKLQVGYRWYDAENVDPLFPFGFGLSYTTFKLDGLQLNRSSDATATVEFDVTNTGKRSGDEVLQVYVGFPAASGEPPKQLRAFARLSLAPGKTGHVRIPLDERAFSIWDTRTDKWSVFNGTYQIFVGNSSRNLPLHTTIEINHPKGIVAAGPDRDSEQSGSSNCCAANLTGNWIVEVQRDDGTVQKSYFNLKQEGEHIAGSIRVTQFYYTISSSTIGPNGFSFTASMKDGPNQRQVTYEGKLGGDELHLKTRRRPEALPEEMVAHRAPSDEGVMPARISPPALHPVPDNGLARTPPMGWNSWNHFKGRIDDIIVRSVADAMANNGMREAGYVYINIDDTWEGERDANGNIQTNKKFPDMKALADYVHGKGLKLGIYSSPGPNTCAGYEGSYGHEAQDARSYAGWGIDYLKYDWCGARNLYSDDEMQAVYQKMGDALQASGRPIVYSLCQYGRDDVWKWGPAVGGNLWRTTGDIRDAWASMSKIGFNQDELAGFVSPGRWNDPDMLEVGNGGMTDDEYRTHMSLWSLLAAPLLAGNDVRSMTPAIRDILLNREVIAIDQDKAGQQGKRVWQSGDQEIWTRDLVGKARAIGFFNRGENAANIRFNWNTLGFPANDRHLEVRDLWAHRDIKLKPGDDSVTVPPHGVVLLRVKSRSHG